MYMVGRYKMRREVDVKTRLLLSLLQPHSAFSMPLSYGLNRVPILDGLQQSRTAWKECTIPCSAGNNERLSRVTIAHFESSYQR
jgi:hypothetical protein